MILFFLTDSECTFISHLLLLFFIYFMLFFFFFSSRRRHTRFLPVSWAREADRPHLVGKTPQVGGEPGGEIAVADGGGTALVLTEFGQHLGRQRYQRVRQGLAERLPDLLLMLGMKVAEQQADGDRLGIGRATGVHG